MYFNDLKLGMSVEIAPAVIEKQKMIDFAYAYDNIPLHTDEAYAKASPFGALIAPGVMSFMSVWAKYLEVDFLERNCSPENPLRSNDISRSTLRMFCVARL